MENSKAALFLSTEKFQDKARGILKEGLPHQPQLHILTKIETGATSAGNVTFSPKSVDKGGLMLYTSGTTNRPVSPEV